jgi:hypothetical protein
MAEARTFHFDFARSFFDWECNESKGADVGLMGDILADQVALN